MATKAQSKPLPKDQPSASFITELQMEGAGNMLGLSATWLEAMSDLSAEVFGFVAARVKEDVKTQHELLHCKSLGELRHIQAKFIQRALDQYRVESGKLVEMSSKTFSQKPDQ